MLSFVKCIKRGGGILKNYKKIMKKIGKKNNKLRLGEYIKIMNDI